jgi:hypothetical protein
MQDHVNPFPIAAARSPWNKGKLTGAKPPLQPKHVWAIRTKLQVEGRPRDLAMSIDSKLRGCDVVALTVHPAPIAAGTASNLVATHTSGLACRTANRCPTPSRRPPPLWPRTRRRPHDERHQTVHQNNKP